MHFQNKRAQNLETLAGIHKKNATLLGTSLLKNWKKIYFATQKLREFIPKK